jgi:HemY protein
LAESFAGRYGRAHKAAQRAITIQDDREDAGDDHEFRTLAHLLAAGSLHRLQDRRRRDEQLHRALRPGRRGTSQAVDDGARLLAAEWALDDRDGPRAEALLAELPPGVARRTQALRLKLQAARLERRPMDALHTARLLANHQAFTSTAAQGLLRSLAIEALDSAHDAEQLRRAWQAFDGADQRDPFVAARAARRAAQLQAADDGRSWLRPLWDRLDSLGADGRAEVALALVDTVAGLGPDWLPRVEAAQRTHPTEPAVQAAVGAVLAERQLWGKARGRWNWRRKTRNCRRVPAARPGVPWPAWPPRKATMRVRSTACAARRTGLTGRGRAFFCCLAWPDGHIARISL